MTIDLTRVAGRTRDRTLADWIRIVAREHEASPTGSGYGSSRFSSPDRTFTVLYAARDFQTAFAEAVVRDRFVGKKRRYLYKPHLEERCVAQLSSQPLRLIDMRGPAAFELGVDTDAPRARNHHPGQTFSQAVHDGLPAVDGLLFDSRLTGEACVAVYGRAAGKLKAAGKARPLLQAPELHDELRRLDIVVRRRRGP